MNPAILPLLARKDIVEIAEEYQNVIDDEVYAGRNPNDTYPDAEAIGREVLRRLRERYAVRPPVTERHDAVLYAAIQATGRQLTATRNPADTLIRAMVAHRLRKEGYSNSEIGRAMGRDHSSVTHLDKKMRDMLSVPGAYKEEMRIYEKFESLC